MKVDEIRRIAVVGAGLLGYQIGMEFALAGYEVRLNDLNEEKLQQAVKNIQADLQTFLDLGLLTGEQVKSVMSRIHTSTVLKDAVEDVDVVVEAVFEDLELKRRVFKELDGDFDVIDNGFEPLMALPDGRVVVIQRVFGLGRISMIGIDLTSGRISGQWLPQADVFWNSEVARTLMLRQEGVLEPYRSPAGEDVPDGFKDPE